MRKIEEMKNRAATSRKKGHDFGSNKDEDRGDREREKERKKRKK